MSSYRSRPPSRYGKVGLKCLVRLAGYYTDGQWQYLQEVKNIPRIAHCCLVALQMCLSHEFVYSQYSMQREGGDIL